MKQTFDDKAATLRKCYLFSQAAPESLAPLAAASAILVTEKGAQIFASEDEADGLRVVLSGGVRIWLADRDGRELTLTLAEPGDAFGEIALLDGAPRTAFATAFETTRCLFLPKRSVQTALQSDPALAQDLILSLCEMLRRNVATISGFAFADLDARLARSLYDLAMDHADIDGQQATFTRRFSQTDIAHFLGVTREAVNKRLRVFEHDGLITRTGPFMILRDLPALIARAEIDADRLRD